MRIDRDLWRPLWQEDDIPSLPCPNCQAPLNFDSNSLTVRTSAHNEELVQQTDLDQVRANFSAWLTCGHAKCGQQVSVSGFCTYDYDSVRAAVIHELCPKSLLPGPHLVALPDEVPKTVRDMLLTSYNVFWLDSEACANRLRVALELILEDEGFPAVTTKGKYFSLHQRIQEWKTTYGAATIATSLMAIKWLGNDGSHKIGISRSSLFDAYDILALLLKRLYPPDERAVDAIADSIVRSREN